MGNSGALRGTLKRSIDNSGVWQVLLARERRNLQDWRGGAGEGTVESLAAASLCAVEL